MRIISKYIKEQKRYSKVDLVKIFELSNDVEFRKFIKKLKSFGIVKVVKKASEQNNLSELTDVEEEFYDEYTNDIDLLYIFTYVGIVSVGNRVIKCYPKYILSNDNPSEDMKQVIKVIEKYVSKEQVIGFYSGDNEDKNFNMLSIILFIIRDYYEYGLYNNFEDIVNISLEGEVCWNRTVSDILPIIMDNRPYYNDLYTKKTIDDDMDFFKRLHTVILTECFQKLNESGLLNIFEFDMTYLSDEEFSDFGDIEYVLYRINSELSIQFNDRKKVLLKSIYAYILNSKLTEEEYGLSLYGTNKFNLVWEDVCAQVFENKLKTKLSKLNLPIQLKASYCPDDRLIDIIEKPTWVGYGYDGITYEKKSKGTLIPDMIGISSKNGNYTFIIMDAKYYNITLSESEVLRGYPGISDITKQYLYQMVYEKFLYDHKINNIKNCFLMPSEGSEIISKGFVKMDIFNFDKFKLQDIQIKQLPSKRMFSYYLRDKTISLEELTLQ